MTIEKAYDLREYINQTKHPNDKTGLLDRQIIIGHCIENFYRIVIYKISSRVEQNKVFVRQQLK